MHVGEPWQIKHGKVPSHGGKHLLYFYFMKVVFFPIIVANVSSLKE
jgi:hypothetical protein